MSNVLIIGSINIDLCIHTEKMPHPGETLHGSGFKENFGGKGANQAIAAARLGENVRFLGAVGTDTYGIKMLDNLKSNGISFCGMVIDGVSSGTAVITVCGGENCIILDSGANALVDERLINESSDLFKWADFVVMQLEIPLNTVLAAAKAAKKHGARVILNPAPIMPLPDELYKYTDIVIPNEHEAQGLTGIEITDKTSAAAAIDKICGMGALNVIITLGENGCAYGSRGNVRFVPARKVKAVDTTAAGDSFIGGVCHCLGLGKSLDDAVYYATAVSSITVSRNGAACSIPTAAEVDALLNEQSTR